MTKPQAVLEMARHGALELRKKINGNIAKAEHATWTGVKAVRADITALEQKMKALAKDQSDAVQDSIKTAIGKLEAAGKLVEDKARTGKDGIIRANAAMLESAHNAATSLSNAVADAPRSSRVPSSRKR